MPEQAEHHDGLPSRHLLIAVALLVLGAIAPGVPSTSADAPKVASAFGTPTLDGVLAPGEWSNATRVDGTVKLPTGSTAPASLYAMNDATNLYVAYRIGTVGSGWWGVSLSFDGNGDGALSEGDQATVVNLWQGDARMYVDGYFTKQPPCTAGAGCIGVEDKETGGTTDGRAVSSVADGATFIEIALPLNDGDDAHDLNLAAGDLLAVTEYSVVDLCGETSCVYSPLPSTDLPIVVAPFAAPAITSFDPTRGPAGTTVTIEGEHLAGATAVTFGGKAAGFDMFGDTIVATVPAGATTGRIAVTAPGGTGTSESPFVVVTPKPVIGPPSRTMVRAGKAATIAFPVTRSDTGAKLVGARMTCDPSIAGRPVAHTDQLRNGTATLRLVVPAGAAGKVLKVRLSVTYRGQTTQRTAKLPIAN